MSKVKGLGSVWEIRQDQLRATSSNHCKPDRYELKTDMDCGPACASFLRYGGAKAQGPIREGGEPVTGDMIRGQHRKMRREAGLAISDTLREEGDERLGLGRDGMEVILREFAAVHADRFYEFKSMAFTANWNLTKGLETIKRELFARLVLHPRGVLVGVEWSNHRDLTLSPSCCDGHLQHYLVLTTISPDMKMAAYFNPAYEKVPKRAADGAIPIKFDNFALAHLRGSRSRRTRAPAETVQCTPVYGVSNQELIPRIKNSDFICELRDKRAWFFKGTDLVARTDAHYFNSYKDADLKAKEHAKEASGAVVEYTPGIFAAVRLERLSDKLVEHVEAVELGPAGHESYLDKNHCASIRVFFREDKSTLLFPTDEVGDKRADSHRPEQK
jgi:hypothetical protein